MKITSNNLCQLLLENTDIKRRFTGEYVKDFSPRAALGRCGFDESSIADRLVDLCEADIERVISSRLAEPVKPKTERGIKWQQALESKDFDAMSEILSEFYREIRDS